MLRGVINELPRAHRECMEFLILHLAQVVDHESKNLVSHHPR